MEFFSKAFTWLADLSAKLPAIEFKTYFFVVVGIILGVGLIVGLTFFGSGAYKLKAACKKIIKYLAEVECIDDDTARDFTNQCFSAKVPQTLRDTWVQYLGVRFGYPSDMVSEKEVYDKEVRHTKDIRANVYIGVALILCAIFAFWGYGTLQSNEMGVVHLTGLLLSGAVYLLLVILNRTQIKNTREAFYTMQEDLDAKVNLQVEKNYATDSSPLTELAAMVDEIIARNTAKIVEISDEMNDYASSLVDQPVEETPIEALIDSKSGNGSSDESEEVWQYDVVSMDEFDDTLNDSDNTDSGSENALVVVPDSEDRTQTDDSCETQINGVDNDDDNDDDNEEYSEGDAEQDEQSDQPTDDEESDETDYSADVQDDTLIEGIAEVVEDSETDGSIGQMAAGDVSDAAYDEDTDDDVAAEQDAEEVKKNKDAQDEQEGVSEIYIVDDVDDDEVVKPAKLVKLPHLVDYMLQRDMSKKTKIQIATMLISTYNKFKDIPEDRKIIISCISRLIQSMQQK